MFNHNRLCETCCAATSTLYCHADMAYLCLSCDSSIHSANMLAARHERISVGPMTCFSPSNLETQVLEHGGDEASSWLLDEPNDGQCFEGDGYLNIANYHYDYHSEFSLSIWENNSTENKSVVPLKLGETSKQEQQEQQLQKFYSEIENNTTQKSFLHYPSSSNQSAIVPFLDADTTQEYSTISTTTNSHSLVPLDNFNLDPTLTPPAGSTITPMSREARVLRYKEKRKMRKFEKTIRYASRKAYAEARPRIKGRFAKKTEMEGEMNNMFLGSAYTDGIVPSL